MVTSTATVSVIIPTFNRSALVDRCLRSIERSDISSVEIIVVDDGGTDDTVDVVKGRARYLRQANAGPAAARNTGFEGSTGEYLCFLDSDDEWTEQGMGRLQSQVSAHRDIDVLFADSSMGNELDGFVSFVETYGTDGFFALPHASRDGVRILERRPFFLQLSRRNVMFLASMLIRREFFVDVGRFDPALRGAADWHLFMRAATRGVVAYSEGPPVSVYHKHDAGMSTDSDHMEADFIRALDAVRKSGDLDTRELGHVEERLRSQVFGWAWLAYERGDFKTARERLRLASELGQMGVREAVYFVVTCLPPGLVGALRRTRHRLSAGR